MVSLDLVVLPEMVSFWCQGWCHFGVRDGVIGLMARDGVIGVRGGVIGLMTRGGVLSFNRNAFPNYSFPTRRWWPWVPRVARGTKHFFPPCFDLPWPCFNYPSPTRRWCLGYQELPVAPNIFPTLFSASHGHVFRVRDGVIGGPAGRWCH